MYQNETKPCEAGCDIEAMLFDVLKEIGVPASLLGSKYMIFAIEKAISNPVPDRKLTRPGGLYDVTAKTFGTTINAVERNIRHAIEVAWGRGDMDTLQRYFGCTVSSLRGRPTNVEFIYTIANMIRIQLKKNGIPITEEES